MHVLTVGVIGMMTIAVMTRASLGYTGRSLVATRSTALSYLLVLLAAAIRPFAEALPEHYNTLLAVSGVAWIAAFCIFVLEYGLILIAKKHRL